MELEWQVVQIEAEERRWKKQEKRRLEEAARMEREKQVKRGGEGKGDENVGCSHCCH